MIIDLIKASYEMVDLFTIVRTLTKLGYSTVQSENVIGVLSTWAPKINMIVVSISIGLTASLIPNIMPSFVKNDFEDVSRKINKVLQILLILTIPMTVGISFLSYPVWNAFYGYNEVGINLLKIYAFLALTLSIQSILVDTAQIMNNTKLSFGSLFIGVMTKLILNVPMMHLCNKVGIDSYYGSTIASFIAQLTTISILLWQLHKQYKISYNETIKILFKTIISTLVMLIGISLLNIIFPINNPNRFMSIIICGVYALIGGIIYFIVSLKFKNIPYITKISDIKNIIKKKNTN